MKTSTAAEAVNESSNRGCSRMNLKGRRGRVIAVSVSMAGIALVLFLLYGSANPLPFIPVSYYYNFHFSSPSPSPSSSESSLLDKDKNKDKDKEILKSVLKNASMEDKTVIVTTLNKAWAEPKSTSMLDLFVKSFQIGNETAWLLDHLVIVGLDERAHARCLEEHNHCYELKTNGRNFSDEAYFMTSEYLDMMWRRIEFLGLVLELGYNFVFTDVDIMWLRNPFQHFYKEGDFQIACDYYSGDPKNLENWPNGGFNYVKSNEKTIEFYKFWYYARLKFPGLHDQDVLNRIKNDPFIHEIGIEIMFLSTAYYGGFCQPSRDFNLVCTMHANCCVGQDNKVHDLDILLHDWERFLSLPPNQRADPPFSWSVPQLCRTSFDHRHLLGRKESIS